MVQITIFLLHYVGTSGILRMCQGYGTAKKKEGEKMEGSFKVNIFTPKEARNYRDLSVKFVAEKLGMSESTYINKENGTSKFYVDEAVNFSDIVNIPFRNIKFF